MSLLPPVPPGPEPEPARTERVMAREDVVWSRPIFKAPRLELDPKKFDVEALAAELRRFGRGER
jgi:hypothetical protein